MPACADRPASVCLFTAGYPPPDGGVATAARRLAGYLVAAGYRLHVVTRLDETAGGAPSSRSDEDGLTVHRLADSDTHPDDWSGFRVRKYLKQLDEEVRFDLFHGFYLTTAYPCTGAAAAAPGRPARPIILSARGSDATVSIDQPGLRGMILHALTRATFVTSVNQTYLDSLGEDVPLTGRGVVIRNGIRLDGPPTWSPDGRRGVVGTVGEFRTVKDIPLLIRAYAAVPADLRRRLLLAGYFSGREEEAWSQVLIEEFGIGAEVELTGPFPHARVDDYFGRMHVYVQSSAYEGLPNALLEAAARGVPLVATAVGGMKEVIEDGKSGLLVPHGEPKMMADAIAAVLRDGELAARLSRGAYALAASLSEERERAAWLDLYRRALAPAGA